MIIIDGSIIASMGAAKTLRGLGPSSTPSAVARRDPDEFLESYRALARCLRTVTTAAYATFEVGSAQAKFLRHIGQDSRISQADLARATGTDPTLTGRVLEPLVERGWVRRTRSEEDRRQYVLELTAAGQRARQKVEEARKRIAARMAKVLDARDLEDFDRIVKKLLAVLEG
jgi:DNA-binding MarR family transcriptional regulator